MALGNPNSTGRSCLMKKKKTSKISCYSPFKGTVPQELRWVLHLPGVLDAGSCIKTWITPWKVAKNKNGSTEPLLAPGGVLWWKKTTSKISCYSPFKGTVSRELRWVLLYINWELFSRADVPHHKILILLKGHFTVYKFIAYEHLTDSRSSLHNFRCSKHVCSAYFIAKDI